MEKHSVWAVVVLAALFWGTPDIADAIIQFLTGYNHNG